MITHASVREAGEVTFFHQQVGYRQITAHDHGECSPEDRSLPEPTLTKEPSVSRVSLAFSISSNTQRAQNLLATQKLGTQTTNLTLWFFELFILSTQKHSVSQLSKTGSTGAFYATPRREGGNTQCPAQPVTIFTIFPLEGTSINRESEQISRGTIVVVYNSRRLLSPEVVKDPRRNQDPWGDLAWRAVMCSSLCCLHSRHHCRRRPSPPVHTHTHQQREQQQQQHKGE